MTCTAPGMNRHTQCSVFLIKNTNNSSFTAFTHQLGCLWLYPQALGVLIKQCRMDIDFHNVSSQGRTYWQLDSTTELDMMTSGSKLAFPERNSGVCFCLMMTSLQCYVAWKILHASMWMHTLFKLVACTVPVKSVLARSMFLV